MKPFIRLEANGVSIGEFDLPQTLYAQSGREYQIREHHHGGGNASVFSATSIAQTGLPVAIKLQRRLDAALLDRFANERRIHSVLEGANIAQYYDYGAERIADYDVPWIAMELGTMNLREHVDRFGPLDHRRLLRASNDICVALEIVHRQLIVHRDVKPANFVWSMNGDSVLMIDFGIAKFFGENIAGRPLDDLTRRNEFVGPQAYSSPELLAYARDKAHPVDSRSDIFQLGKVIWYLATGTISAGIPSKRLCPFAGELHSLVLSCLNDSPQDRPQTVSAVRRSLGAMSPP